MIPFRIALVALLLLPGVTGAMGQSLPPVAGAWDGTYWCAQGQTALHLVVDAAPDGRLSAVFDFSNLPPARAVFSGSFNMQGSFDANGGRVVLQPGDWTRRPAGFVAVGLDGALECSNTRLRGRVTGGFGCSTFELYRPGAARCVEPPALVS